MKKRLAHILLISSWAWLLMAACKEDVEIAPHNELPLFSHTLEAVSNLLDTPEGWVFLALRDSAPQITSIHRDGTLAPVIEHPNLGLSVELDSVRQVFARHAHTGNYNFYFNFLDTSGTEYLTTYSLNSSLQPDITFTAPIPQGDTLDYEFMQIFQTGPEEYLLVSYASVGQSIAQVHLLEFTYLDAGGNIKERYNTGMLLSRIRSIFMHPSGDIIAMTHPLGQGMQTSRIRFDGQARVIHRKESELLEAFNLWEYNADMYIMAGITGSLGSPETIVQIFDSATDELIGGYSLGEFSGLVLFITDMYFAGNASYLTGYIATQQQTKLTPFQIYPIDVLGSFSAKFILSDESVTNEWAMLYSYSWEVFGLGIAPYKDGQVTIIAGASLFGANKNVTYARYNETELIEGLEE